MKNLKTVIWILILSLFYAAGVLRLFNISAELLLCFSGIFAVLSDNFKKTVAVSLVCGIIMCSIGGRGFVYSMLSCAYFALIFLRLRPKKLVAVKNIVTAFMFFVLFEGLFYVVFCFDDMAVYDALLRVVIPSAVYNACVFSVLYAVVRRSYKEKERYIF